MSLPLTTLLSKSSGHTLRRPSWRTCARVMRYTLDYKLPLLISVVFALVVTLSFTTVIVGIGAAVNLLFGDTEKVVSIFAGYIKSFVEFMPFTSAILPFPPGEADVHILDWVSSIRSNGPAMFQVLIWVAGGAVGLITIAGVARYLQEYYAGYVGTAITVRLGEEMYRNVIRLSVRFFEERSSGEIIARFSNDIFNVNQGLAGVFTKVMREPFKAAAALTVALKMNAFLTLAGLIGLPLVGYVMVWFGRRIKKHVRRSLERIGGAVGQVNETFSGIVIIKVFCMEEREIARIHEQFTKLRHHLLRQVRATAMVNPIVEWMLVFGLAGFVLAGAREVTLGRMMGGDFVTLILALATMLDPIRKLAAVNNIIQASIASAERIFEFLDASPEIEEAPDAVAIPVLSEGVRFNHVSFSYDGARDVLRDVSFEVKKGEMIALVGLSGAGKSTIIKLLPRFYDVSAGSIEVDGVDIRHATFHSLREQMGIVTQNTILFNQSIRDNIAFGSPDFTDERVREAARAASAEGFVDMLPQGFDTVIGELGSSLSGGQRQRLAIARAIVKSPAILILDEATANLDSESERAIQDAIERFVIGRTTIVIAHRLSTIQRADRIIVLDEGRIAEEGTHDQLLGKNGIYRRLYETQFLTILDPPAEG